MLTFFSKKLLELIPTLIGISLLTFFLVRIIPGDPVMMMLGERGSDPALYLEMKKNLGLDLPVYQQYLNYIGNMFHGDFGTSLVSKTPVLEEFWNRFPATLELSFVALLFAFSFGLVFGILAAVKHNSLWDYLLMTFSLVGYSMPIFWWGLILIIIFSVGLGLTPVAGRISMMFDFDTITGFYLIDTLINTELIEEEGFAPFVSSLSHLILPAIAMGTIPMAIIARMTRSSLLEVLHEEYIKVAKAKGLSPFRVVVVHALKNALIPIVTIAGLMFGTMITGAILTETIFSWPGIGKWLVASINARDYPVIQSGVLIIASMVVVINASVDLLYQYINPTLRK